MKRILFTGWIMLIAIILQAQQLKFGVNAGVIDSDILFEIVGSNGGVMHMRKTGFQGGAIADISFNSNFSVQPRLLFITKGGRVVTNVSTAGISITTLDLPLHLVYHYNGFFLGAGPNISYGLSAKDIDKGAAVNNPLSKNLYKDSSGLVTGMIIKRLDIGLAATMGFEFPGGFLISVNYLKGISNINKVYNLKIRNNFYGFSVGYFLQPKTKH